MDLRLVQATQLDIDFAFEVKKQAMKPYIDAKWGWDERFQKELHRHRFAQKSWFLILYNAEAVGTVSIDHQAKHVRFGEFYIADDYRGQGIGTKILSDFLVEMDKGSHRVILEYLKWNPVGSLYKRHGFEPFGENEIHFFMAREPSLRR